MKIHFLDTLFNVTGMHAVFATLVASLWLGAAMALLTAIIIVLTKRSGPQLRYKLLTGLLTLFVAATLYIFFDVFSHTINTIENNSVMMIAGNTMIQGTPDNQQQKTITDTLLTFIETHSDIIVSLWFIVICFKCVQLISGLRNVQRLKKRNITEAGSYWNRRMSQLAAKINITKPVVLLQSSLAKIPMVIGHLKPVILFPVGILNALSPNEVEAILLHELAHIKRNDFLVNLLQQFAAVFFFFNPAVLWILSLIKNERENCCDDIAIAVTQDKKIFIRALVTFHEYNNAMSYATAFGGAKNHLLNRVKRIITNNNKTLSNMEKLILTSGIIITCIITVAFSPVRLNDKKTKTKTPASLEGTTQTTASNSVITGETAYQSADFTNEKSISNNDTLPEKEITTDSGYNMNYNGEVDGKRIRLKEENSRIKELYIDGKKIPEDQYDQYKSLVEKIHRQIKENAAQLKINADQLKQKKIEIQKQKELMQKEVEKMKEQSILMQKDFKEQQEILKKQQGEMQKQIGNDSAKVLSQKMQKEFQKQVEQFKIKQVEFQKKVEELRLQQEKLKEIIRDSIKTTISISQQPIAAKSILSVKTANTLAATVAVKPAPELNNAAISLSNIPTVKAQSSVTLAVAPIAASVYTSSISEDIIRELEDAKIITSRNNLSFHLTNDELIVNGVKQPDDIHQKILKKYVRKPEDKISLSYNIHE
jgi:beta-lactamase regulating signal transducer with metallopeptidase domain